MILDLFIGLAYLVVILFILFFYASNKYKNDLHKRNTFLIALSLKLVAAMLYGMVQQFYYGYGDSVVYHIAAKEYLRYIINHPNATLDFLFLNKNILYNNYSDFLNSSTMIYDYFNNGSIMVHRFALILGLPSMYFFFPTNLLFALIGFFGCWKLYNVLSELYPDYEKFVKISFLFLPSIVYWTAGIGKDAICIGFINFFVAFAIEAFIFKRKIILNLLLCLFLLNVVLVIKSYIVLSILPFFTYYIFAFHIKKIKSGANKFLARFSIITMILISTVVILVYTNIVEIIGTEILDNAFHLAKGQQNTDFGNESKYDLGITISDIESKNIKPFILPSLVVALFRPYLWEIHKPLVIFSFLESCFFLFFTIYVLFKGKIYHNIRLILTDEFLLFIFGYSLVFAFFVGLVSANFGTLIRYKTPFIGYFLLALYIMRHKLIKKNDSESVLSQ